LNKCLSEMYKNRNNGKWQKKNKEENKKDIFI
jgi:hypothetical protein